ncbi:maltotransferase domain-containing protein, partial [Mycobacterium tuberculosis]
MPGRVEIDDVAPVVSCGVYPAKAVVGEVVPVSAAVWREGHEAVAATLVVRSGEAAHEKTRKRFTINAKTHTSMEVVLVKHPSLNKKREA